MSNLLQKASIITTPTAYDTGKILSVKPVQYYGPELVTNGDFSNGINSWQGTDASSLLSVVLGELKIENGDGSSAGANSSITTEIGKEYRITFVSNKGTAVEGVFFGAGTSTNSVNLLDVTDNFDGIHTETFTATTTTTWFIAKTLSTVNGQFSYIDNVSVKEVINADFDFSRNSSATRVGSNGLIQDVASNLPRIDYTGGVGSWKFEPQRTNVVKYSESFSNSYWVKATVSLSSNQIISPNGALDADKIIESSTNGLQQIYSDVITTTPSSDYVYSIFIKKGERSWVKVMTANNSGANFNVEDGVVGIVDSGITANIENYGNGWFKCSVSFNTSVSADRVYVRISTSNGVTSYQGDGSSGLYIFGAMLEQGSFPTSYIPNNGESGGVTRLADVANNAGSSDLINSTQGVLYAEISALANDGTSRHFSINDGSAANKVEIYFDSTSNEINGHINVNGASSAIFSQVITSVSTFNKVLVKYKLNDFLFFVNGFKLGTDTSGVVFPNGTLNNLSFDKGNGTLDFYGNTKSVAVFKEALTDLELECLVSWMSFSDLGINFGYTVE